MAVPLLVYTNTEITGNLNPCETENGQGRYDQ